MNFRRILSKSSLRSSSSAKSSSDEVSKLQSEIESLKQTIESLKISVESRDAAVGTLAREKEKLFVELKSAQRTNRNLHQQIVDERDMHAKEKEYLIEEIKRLSKNNRNEINIKQDIPDETQSCSSSQEELKAKDEIIYNICIKYLKIKSSKEEVLKKLEKLQDQCQKICESVIYCLYDNRKAMDTILGKLIRAAYMPPTSRNYLKLLKINSNLHYENTQLKVLLSLKEINEISSESDESFSEDHNKVNASLTRAKLKSKGILSMQSTKAKQKIDRYRSLHSKPYRLPKYEATKNFCHIHEILSPHFRRKKFFSSEPCLVRR